ncbi:MAG: hypothetical protein J2P15_24515 [Micromonosporaceae bacterium]|nr:hypothetical protein [Micromonosporaceae bacterium]
MTGYGKRVADRCAGGGVPQPGGGVDAAGGDDAPRGGARPVALSTVDHSVVAPALYGLMSDHEYYSGVRDVLLPWVQAHKRSVDELQWIGGADRHTYRIEPDLSDHAPDDVLHVLNHVFDVLIAPTSSGPGRSRDTYFRTEPPPRP